MSAAKENMANPHPFLGLEISVPPAEQQRFSGMK